MSPQQDLGVLSYEARNDHTSNPDGLMRGWGFEAGTEPHQLGSLGSTNFSPHSPFRFVAKPEPLFWCFLNISVNLVGILFYCLILWYPAWHPQDVGGGGSSLNPWFIYPCSPQVSCCSCEKLSFTMNTKVCMALCPSCCPSSNVKTLYTNGQQRLTTSLLMHSNLAAKYFSQCSWHIFLANPYDADGNK